MGASWFFFGFGFFKGLDGAASTVGLEAAGMERAGVGDSGGWKWSGVGRRGCCVLGVRAGAGPEAM